MSDAIIRWLEDLLFGYRRTVVALFVIVTVVLGYYASRLSVDAGFEKLLPLAHPYIQTFTKYRDEFGGADRLLIAVRAKEGDIFTPEFFTTLKGVTDEVFFLPGVNRSSVRSLYTPNVRYIEIVEGGFVGGNVIPPDFQTTPEFLALVRSNILKSGIVGRLVANDFTAAMVSADLIEIDPATGKRLDYLKVAADLDDKIRDKFERGNIDIHVIGFAKAVGDIAAGAAGVIGFFAVSFVLTVGLVYVFTHLIRLTLPLLLCSLMAVIWNLGIVTLAGFGIDPLSILVPFLIFAIGVSHGVQITNAVRAEIFLGNDCATGARNAFRRLVAPGAVALATDTVGFLAILLINIRIVQEMAITASIGVAVLILTNLVLLPVLLSFITTKPGYREHLHSRAQLLEPIWSVFALVARPRYAAVSIAVAALLFAVGLYHAPQAKIGDLHAGIPELRPDSRYNRDSAMIARKFSIGVDVISVVVETVPDGCIQFDVMDAIDRFQWHMANVAGVQSTLSMPQVAKVIAAGWNEGNPKWRVLPRNPQTMVQAVSPIETATGLLNRNCSAMPVMIFTDDHKAETIERVVDTVKAYAAKHDSDRHAFRLATGNVGVMAATNEIVAAAQVDMLVYVYAAIVVLCLLSFRSWRATVCIVLPLTLVSVLCYALMAVLEIGLKVSTLPVVALGVGIGVDYGIYIFNRYEGLAKELGDVHAAYRRTLSITGNAVLVTGLTLSISVGTWAFSALQFQADMGLLLSFMFVANMLGALLLLPALTFALDRLTGKSKTARAA